MKFLNYYKYASVIVIGVFFVVTLMHKSLSVYSYAGFAPSRTGLISRDTLIGAFHYQVAGWITAITLCLVAVGFFIGLYHILKYLIARRKDVIQLIVGTQTLYIGTAIIFSIILIDLLSDFFDILGFGRLLTDASVIISAGIFGTVVGVSFFVIYSIGYGLFGRLLPVFSIWLMVAAFMYFPHGGPVWPYVPLLLMFGLLLWYGLRTLSRYIAGPHDSQPPNVKEHLVFVGKLSGYILGVFWFLLGIYAIAHSMSPDLIEFNGSAGSGLDQLPGRPE